MIVILKTLCVSLRDVSTAPVADLGFLTWGKVLSEGSHAPRSSIPGEVQVGVIHKGIPRYDLFADFPSLHVHFCSPVAGLSPSPSCGRLHLTLDTALLSGSVTADVLKKRCSLISSSQHAAQSNDKVNRVYVNNLTSHHDAVFN